MIPIKRLDMFLKSDEVAHHVNLLRFRAWNLEMK